MSLLAQLRSQASDIQEARKLQDGQHEQRTADTEAASQRVLGYFDELARQLRVIEPPGPRFSLDGKTPFPPMKLRDFRSDARKKTEGGKELFEYIAIAWQVVPSGAAATSGSVTVNFPPDLQRVEARLLQGSVKYDRTELRHPEKQTLQAIRFDYLAQTRGSVTARPDHKTGLISFRLVNTAGFDIETTQFTAAQISTATLDELAKRLLSQPNRFL